VQQVVVTEQAVTINMGLSVKEEAVFCQALFCTLFAIA
jgi:hypothetical protein